jgi:hypothetical protein
MKNPAKYKSLLSKDYKNRNAPISFLFLEWIYSYSSNYFLPHGIAWGNFFMFSI